MNFISDALGAHGLAALICSLPANVLLLSGYWPVVGTAIAIATREGRVSVLAPADEADLAAAGWADDLRTFEPGRLDELRAASGAALEPLSRLAAAIGLAGKRVRVGFEGGAAMEPAAYVALHVYGAGMRSLLAAALPRAELLDAGSLLARLRSVKTSREVARIEEACRVAERAFRAGVAYVAAGATESAVAAAFRGPLSTDAPDGRRAGGFAYCMSGENAAQAGAAYARSRGRKLGQGEMALVHCNSYLGGFWTDITRTYCTGVPGERQMAMYDAVFVARAAALAAVRPGARARDVDGAARAVLRKRGFGDGFTHATGHGVGFAAIDHNARPALHPRSDDVLESGMVFNIEPAIYERGFGGLRHCDVVALMDDGARVLTPFHDTIEELSRG